MESENVKERLTNMLHKKRSDLQDREQKEVEFAEFSKTIKQEKDDSNLYQETANEINASSTTNDYQEHFITLQEILDEKKKALLHNPDVIRFLQNKK